MSTSLSDAGLVFSDGTVQPSAAFQIQTAPTPTLAANAMTIPSIPLALSFRSTALGSGVATVVSGSPAALTIPSTATLGTISGVASSLMLLVMNNAGTLEYAVVNLAGGTDLSETGLISTTAIAAGSNTSNVVYSASARTSLAYRVLARIDSTQATAGTWVTAPTLVQGAGGRALQYQMLTTPAIATTSGTAFDFTGIPSWAKRITVMLNGVSTNGTSVPLIQLGTSGGIQATVYDAAAFTNGLQGPYTTGIPVFWHMTAATLLSGSMQIRLGNAGTGTWVASATIGYGAGNDIGSSFGEKALGGTLDRIRLTTVNGTDTFDLGSVSLLIEGC